jgi:hypothetical protein
MKYIDERAAHYFESALLRLQHLTHEGALINCFDLA